MKLVILDRDGVINEDSPNHIRSVAEWLPIPGSLEAIAQLNHAGYRVVVCTNQSGLARGYFDIENLQAIHREMQKQLSLHGGYIDAVFYCPHGPDDGCDCRKPKPGLLLNAAQRLKTDLTHVVMVGDTERDLVAAQAAGAKGVLVRTGKGAWAEKKMDKSTPVYDDLAAFVQDLLSNQAAVSKCL